MKVEMMYLRFSEERKMGWVESPYIHERGGPSTSIFR